MPYVGGRLEKAPLPNEEKHPVIVPHKHHVTELLIVHYHQKVVHSGVGITSREEVLSERLLGTALNVKDGIRAWTAVHVSFAERKSYTLSATIHQHRIDYFGPFLVKQRRSSVKRYGCIFTCLPSRAVHLEVSHSLDADSFIHTLRGFINWRGHLQRI
ncbi:hypothetical protein HOLleu_34561 [Holothuria leucospilota]|uniref:Uncharacterized protein n=1 Tax=Holothuria leucospilota TaxID=206669 RepID=A0A9Q0YQ79_HOLLE|nr:hypothetical protein HOLleu_34561 [Holothuria leucospilota]